MAEFSDRRASIYGLFDPNDGIIRYIGKANDPASRLKCHMRDSLKRDTPVYRWIRKIGAPEMVILSSDCADWAAEERRLIAEARARGDDLLNVADGGNAPFCPDHVRAENGRKSAKARVSTPEKRKLYKLKHMLGLLLQAGQVSEETRRKMRQAAVTHPRLLGDWIDV